MTKASLLLTFLTPLALAAFPVHAQDATAESLHVIRPALHTEQEDAELCLEFDHALDALGATARIASSVHLESDGKTIPVSSKMVSFGGNQLCLSSLEHRKDYRLQLGALKDAKGEKISHAYSLTFTVPARQASVAFVAKENRDGLALWRDHPLLHSVNAAKITVELYRISDPARIAEAWTQRLQTTLAPSESVYFAHANGTLLWKGDLAPGADKNIDKNVESKIDFGGKAPGDFSPGFYLLTAVDEDPPPPKNTAAKDEQSGQDKSNSLTPTAAMWLVRSGLDLHAFRDGVNIAAFTEKSDASAVLSGVRVVAMNGDQKIAGETESDANGQAILTLKDDKNNLPQMLLGLTSTGDVAFFDLAHGLDNPVLPPLIAKATLDQTTYAPADKINITLMAHDLHNRAVNVSGSSLQLQRPDKSVFDSEPVMLDAAGAAKLTFSAPVANGLWRIVWKKSDGVTLTETDLRISANPEAPKLTMIADRNTLGGDGGVNLTFHSVTNSNAPAPFINGRINVTWLKSLHPFDGWRDYLFDDGTTVDGASKPVGSFLTGKDGMARSHVNVAIPATASSLLQARVTAVSEPSLGALDPDPLVLTVKPSNIVVGLKPRAANGHFAENSVAHFDVVALDGDGQRQPVEDVTYQIYEEGRGFEWFQSEGHWDFKPQQYRRRIGGGNLNFSGEGMAVINNPVTSGAYQLEVTNAEGTLLAREGFNAGWGFSQKDNQADATLDLKALPATLQSGMQQNVSFHLTSPALITAVIADDHVRAIFHAAYPAGANRLSFTSAADWGNHVAIHVEARYATGDSNARGEGQLLLASEGEMPVAAHSLAKNSVTAKAPLSFSNLALSEIARHALPPNQSWMPPAKHIMQNETRSLIVAPEPVFDLFAVLPSMLDRHPLATESIARQLEALRQWRGLIIISGLMTEGEWHARESDLALRLLARQASDGGFAPFAGGLTSDMISTAVAIEALNPIADATTRPAVDQAVQWLQHHLGNTWFDESERPQRAAAYAALAMAAKLDVGSLHYFSDTSAEKGLPVLASAQMAYAFASINDRPAAAYWLDKTKTAATGDNVLSYPASVLPVLMANGFFAPHDALSSLEAASKLAVEKPDNVLLSANVLSALARIQDRAGTWRLAHGREERDMHGVAVEPLTDKSIFALRNPSGDRTLTMAIVGTAKISLPRSGIQRHIYNLDGDEAEGHLTRGATYLVTLEGAFPRDAEGDLAVHESPIPVLDPITCSLQAPSADAFLGWLSYKAPQIAKACERSADGLDFLLAHADKESGIWRIAYLARATGGDLRSAEPATARALSAPGL